MDDSMGMTSFPDEMTESTTKEEKMSVAEKSVAEVNVRRLTFL